ncbi:hypothetical protein ACQY0O_007482 [Thecaphora frezii]
MDSVELLRLAIAIVQLTKRLLCEVALDGSGGADVKHDEKPQQHPALHLFLQLVSGQLLGTELEGRRGEYGLQNRADNGIASLTLADRKMVPEDAAQGPLKRLQPLKMTFIEETRLWLTRHGSEEDLARVQETCTKIFEVAMEPAATAEDDHYNDRNDHWSHDDDDCKGRHHPGPGHHSSAFLRARALLLSYVALASDTIGHDDEQTCLQASCDILEETGFLLCCTAELVREDWLWLADASVDDVDTMIRCLIGTDAIVLDSGCEVLSHRSAAELAKRFTKNCLPAALDLVHIADEGFAACIADALVCTFERILLRDAEFGIMLASGVIAEATTLLQGVHGPLLCCGYRSDADDPSFSEPSFESCEVVEEDCCQSHRELQKLIEAMADLLTEELLHAAGQGVSLPVTTTRLLGRTLDKVLSNWPVTVEAADSCADLGSEDPLEPLRQTLLQLEDLLAWITAPSAWYGQLD